MRMLLKGKHLYLAVIIVFTISACEYDNPVPIAQDTDIPISFSANIQPIFDAGCNGLGCHSVGAIQPDLTPGNSYNALFLNDMIDTLNPANSGLYISITTGSMNGYLSNANDAELILSWIKQGALDN